MNSQNPPMNGKAQPPHAQYDVQDSSQELIPEASQNFLDYIEPLTHLSHKLTLAEKASLGALLEGVRAAEQRRTRQEDMEAMCPMCAGHYRAWERTVVKDPQIPGYCHRSTDGAGVRAKPCPVSNLHDLKTPTRPSEPGTPSRFKDSTPYYTTVHEHRPSA